MKTSQHCLLSYSTHAMSVSGLDDPKDSCEGTRSWLMDIARRLRFLVRSARSVERNSPPSPMPEFTFKRQSCSRSKSCNIRSIFYSTRPEQPLQVFMALFLKDDLLKSDKKQEESFRGDSARLDLYFRAPNDQPGTATQGDSRELPRHRVEESRSLVNNSVSYGQTQNQHRYSPHTTRHGSRADPTSHSGQSIGAMVTLSFLRTAPSPSVTLSNPEDLEQRSVNLLVARKTTKGDKCLLRIRPHTSAVPAWNEAFQMLTHWVKSFTMQLLPAQKPVTSPVEPAVTPTSRDGVAGRETPRNSESPTFCQVLFFFLSETVGAPRQRCA